MTEIDTEAVGLQELVISRLGYEGDGIADTPGGAVYVPYTLAGERVRATVAGDRAALGEVITASPDRVVAVCRHFQTCGGCAMQHLSSDRYVAWKAGILGGALSQHGIAANVVPMVSAGLGTRRRANFGAKRGPHGVLLGFHEPRGHRILDLAECPILSPEIANRLPALRTLLDAVLPRNTGLRLIVTVVANGVDVVIEGAGTAPTPGQREAIAAAAREARLLRVSLDRDPIYVAGEPVLRFGTVDVVPPPGVFLQAVPEIDAAMARTIVNALGKKAKRVADLFCGLGTFTFPIAARAEVHAIDSDKRALAALEAAHKRAQGVKPVTVLARDLMRDPLSSRELDGFDAVVLDPPRAGAQDQASRIAKSKVPTVIAVSCAPGTLARDLEIMLAGGYVIDTITPFDQFLYSQHLETVAVLRRER